MATSFDRWEKDPFFSAAEEVQESADRMESTYRTWVHAKSDASSMWDADELRRDLQTALGTTKWQLEEFERAVKSSYIGIAVDDARVRHQEFIIAIRNQTSNMESFLQGSSVSEGNTSMPWARLDEGECNELALFLSGPPVTGDRNPVEASSINVKLANHREADNESLPQCSMDSCHSTERGSREEKLHGHRRTASASADIGAWKISVADGGLLQSSLSGKPELPPRRVPSFSGFLSTMESASKLKWPKSGFRKWKITDRQKESDGAPLHPLPLSRSMNGCYERSKSCLEGCDNCYEKQLDGWYGAIQRQLQRSQYHMQYSRPVQVIFWVILLICLIVLVAMRAI